MTWADIVAEIALQGGYVASLRPKAFDASQGLLHRDRVVAEMAVAAVVRFCQNPLPPG